MSVDPAAQVALTGASQARMLTLASQALAKVPSSLVPASLRKSARFTPTKRARLIGPQLQGLVESDGEFREHLAVQVRALVPDLAQMVDDNVTDPANLARDQLNDAAAVAYLLRSPGWEGLVRAASEAELARRTAPGGDLSQTVDRLTESLAQSKRDLQQTRDKARRQVDELKADNTQLRRTLGQARTDLKQARAEAAAHQARADEARQTAEAGARQAEAEARRLRARVNELESDNSAAKRAIRDDRDAEVMRLRLLLETMTEAAAGLRRELALPI